MVKYWPKCSADGGPSRDGSDHHTGRKVTLQQSICQELKRLIMFGRFVPGETITYRAMGHTLGTSVQPVRDAAWRLITDHSLSTSEFWIELKSAGQPCQESDLAVSAGNAEQAERI